MTEASLQSATLPVLGMSCASCQHHVEGALRAAPGVVSARVDLIAGRATVQFDPQVAGPESLVEAIRAAGYDAVLPRGGRQDHAAAPDAESTTAKALVTLAAGFGAMVLSMPLSGRMGGADRLAMRAAPALYALPPDMIRRGLLLATALLLAWAGRSIYISAARALAHGETNMNTLVSLGTGAAFAWSAFATLRPAPARPVYVDAVLLIVGFLLLGKALEARAKRGALFALDSLSRLLPATARLAGDGASAIVPLEKVRLGDRVLVLPGERFPVDATILQGRTTVDESMLTGESTPLPRGPGAQVLAGSLNYEGAVTCLARSLGQDTLLAQIARVAHRAQQSRAPLERIADRAGAIFVPVVLAVAALTFAAWFIAVHSMAIALANTVAVLVVACPCAMGLAVPAALTVAVGRGAQLGILFKGGEALERLARVDAVALDKTGTITIGRPALMNMRSFSGRDERELLSLAASLEDRSNHPLAYAILDRARALGLAWQNAQDAMILPGRGIAATVANQACLLGSEDLMRESGIGIPSDAQPPEQGATRLWLAIDGAAAGLFDARDALREDAEAAVAALRSDGMRVSMITGDSAGAAAPIAELSGIRDVKAGLDPAGKLAAIRALKNSGLSVAMAGDGINDAAALAEADAGIAMGSGADLAQEAGDVLLLRASPGNIVNAIRLARRTVAVMRQNLVWAAVYNVLGVPLAAGLLYRPFHILLSPWLAAAAMALSSVCVLGNSLRLRRWRPPAQSAAARERLPTGYTG